MRRWSKLMIEIYQPDRYDGRWVIENGELGLDLEYVQSCVRSLRNDARYRDARFQFLTDGEDCVIGVFCGREPPERWKSGTVLPSEMFDSIE